MHAVFWTFGKKENVDRYIRWLETRIFPVKFKDPEGKLGFKDKDGNVLKEGIQPFEGVVRYGLFGTWEYIFPEECADEVLNTLYFNAFGYNYYGKLLQKARLKTLQLMLGCKKIPKFKTDKELILPNNLRDGISIIPIGVRYDRKDGFGAEVEAL